MKVALTVAILAFAVGLNPSARAQQLPGISGVAQPDYTTQRTAIGTNSKNASGAAPAAAPDQEEKTAEEDDALYRGRTDEMETSMMRDDGMLHYKSHGIEKAQKVDSKKLLSSGTDPKFQGKLALSPVSSIDQIAAKSGEPVEATQGEDLSGSRFQSRDRKFTPQTDDKPKKAESDSTPSPTPSPTASPETKKSSDSKK